MLFISAHFQTPKRRDSSPRSVFFSPRKYEATICSISATASAGMGTPKRQDGLTKRWRLGFNASRPASFLASSLAQWADD